MLLKCRKLLALCKTGNLLKVHCADGLYTQFILQQTIQNTDIRFTVSVQTNRIIRTQKITHMQVTPLPPSEAKRTTNEYLQPRDVDFVHIEIAPHLLLTLH